MLLACFWHAFSMLLGLYKLRSGSETPWAAVEMSFEEFSERPEFLVQHLEDEDEALHAAATDEPLGPLKGELLELRMPERLLNVMVSGLEMGQKMLKAASAGAKGLGAEAL